MSDLPAVTNSTDLVMFDDEKIELIKRTVAKGATDDELSLFLHQAQKTGLDPLARQIYFQKYNTKNGSQMAIITGIDGYRLVADRTNRYAGSSDAEYGETKSDKYYDTKYYYPVWARVTVRKFVKGIVCEFAASASWYEYYPGDKKGAMWRKMPRVMLAKCAEALALRKAFPADLSGVYTRDEMDQAANYGDVPMTQPAIAATTTAPPPQQADEGEGEIIIEDEPEITIDEPSTSKWRTIIQNSRHQTVESFASILVNAMPDRWGSVPHAVNSLKKHYPSMETTPRLEIDYALSVFDELAVVDAQQDIAFVDFENAPTTEQSAYSD